MEDKLNFFLCLDHESRFGSAQLKVRFITDSSYRKLTRLDETIHKSKKEVVKKRLNIG